MVCKRIVMLLGCCFLFLAVPTKVWGMEKEDDGLETVLGDFLSFGSGFMVGVNTKKDGKGILRNDIVSYQPGGARFFVGYDLLQMDEDQVATSAMSLAGYGLIWVTAKDLTWDQFTKKGSTWLQEGTKEFVLKKVAHYPSLWVAIGMYAGVTYKRVFGKDSEGEVETVGSKQDPKTEPETSDKKTTTPPWHSCLALNGIKCFKAAT